MSELLFAVLLGFVSGTGPNRLGLVPEDLDTVPGMMRVTGVRPLAGMPDADSIIRVDHSPEMPPVGNQGAQSSCVAWALGYYLKTQTEAREHGWEVNDPRHQFSPSFLYNQVNGGRDGGTSGSTVMRLMCEQGCASMALSPYNQYNCTSWPSETAYSAALPFRALEPCYIPAADPPGIRDVRQHLANGSTCILGIQVWANFDNIRNFRNTYCSSERYGQSRGWHAVCCVGYDDTLPTSDGPGAFRMVNSWGTGFGDNGYFWMSYAAVMDPLLSGRQMEYPSDRTGYEPALVGRVFMEHGTRDRIRLELGVGGPEQPRWYYEFSSWRRAQTDQPFPANPIAFDLTDGAEFLNGEPGDSAYVVVTDELADGLEGEILGFTVEHRQWYSRGISEDTPVRIPDDGVPVAACAPVPASAVEEPAASKPLESSSLTVIRGMLELTPQACGGCPCSLL